MLSDSRQPASDSRSRSPSRVRYPAASQRAKNAACASVFCRSAGVSATPSAVRSPRNTRSSSRSSAERGRAGRSSQASQKCAPRVRAM